MVKWTIIPRFERGVPGSNPGRGAGTVPLYSGQDISVTWERSQETGSEKPGHSGFFSRERGTSRIMPPPIPERESLTVEFKSNRDRVPDRDLDHPPGTPVLVDRPVRRPVGKHSARQGASKKDILD
jgi:hypothetical protein